jgi:hypothetical protein
MFLSKLLSGRNNLNKPKQELLTDAWTSVQRYYETASDPLKDAIELTPIPTCLQNIVKLIQSEEFDYQRANDNLATGPCLEYLLQTRVLEELVEFAKVDASISPTPLKASPVFDFYQHYPFLTFSFDRLHMACVFIVYAFSPA